MVLAVPAVADAPTTPLLLSATVDDCPDPGHRRRTSPTRGSRTAGRPRPDRRSSTGGHRAARRSLPRTLVGVGAVIVAALVLVALFRPDGPLDPPLDPGAGNATQLIAPAEVATAPTAGVPGSGPVAGIRAEVDADAACPGGPSRGAVDTRQSVTTTPPALPSPSDFRATPHPGPAASGPLVVRREGAAHRHDAAGAPASAVPVL